MNCKFMKLKLNRQLECKLLKKVIKPSVCNDCPFKALKQARTRTKLLGKSNTLAQLERKRTSLFTHDLEHCYVCGRPKEHLHEVYEGRNRKNSMMYQMVLPLCRECHDRMHSDVSFALKYKQKGQALFTKVYPNLNFEDIFKKNYLT